VAICLKEFAEGINGVSGVCFIIEVLRFCLGYGLSVAIEPEFG